jgi:hypothetical protein
MAVLDEFVAALAMWEGQSPNGELTVFAEAIGQMFLEVEQYTVDTDPNGNPTQPSWSVMLDPTLCPIAGLPYLAQWVGEILPFGIGPTDMRNWIIQGPNQIRGTPLSIARAAWRYLNGSKTVQIWESHRLDGTANVDYIAVRVYEHEVTNLRALMAQLRAAVPADIILDFLVSTGAIWEDIFLGYTSWAALHAAKSTWSEVTGVTASYNIWIP